MYRTNQTNSELPHAPHALALGVLTLALLGAPGARANNSALDITRVIDDFQSGKMTWTARSQVTTVRKEYTVIKEGENFFLRGAPKLKAEDKVALTKFKINVKDTPYLSWRWRVIAHPTLEPKLRRTVRDHAVALYVHFPHGLFGARLLKYVWAVERPPSDWMRPRMAPPFHLVMTKVIRNKGPIGEWVTETVDLRKDYMEAFNDTRPPDIAEGIGVMTDGSQSPTLTIGDYDDFRVSSAPPK